MARSEGTGRTVVVTGASRGLGRTIAMDLSGRGFRVFAGVRNAADADRLNNEDIEQLRPIMLDVTDPGAIDSAVEEVTDATGGSGVYALVNNAGVFALGPVEQTPMSVIDQQLRVNLVGAIAVTQRFLPQLREGKGRIVNISSVNGKISIPFSGVYSASKFGLEAISDALRVELKPWGIPVSIVEPGATNTDIRLLGMQRWSEQRADLSAAERELYADVHDKARSIVESVQQTAAGHEHVAEAVRQALTDEPPKIRYQAGPDWEQWSQLLALTDDERDEALLELFE